MSGRKILLVLVLGSLIRLALAWNTTGNYDRESWEIVSRIALAGGNVYAETSRYNASPVWFWTLGALARLQALFPFLEFKFLFRALLTGVDLASCFVLMSLAGAEISRKTRIAALFYLNPVSFLLTGYHGQFDNLAIFFLLLGLRCYGSDAVPRGGISKPTLVPNTSPRDGVRLLGLWFWTTVGMITKHIIFYELLIVLQTAFKKTWLRLCLLAGSCLLFALSFLPYWREGGEGIIQNVLLYGSYAMPYGLSAFSPPKLFTAFFVAALFIYPWFIRNKELGAQALLGTLFFLVFTPGIGVQYFILPIALGALRPSRGFFVFSLVTSLYLLGSYFNLHLRMFSWVPLGAVWFAAAYWWITESLVHPKTA